MHQRGYNIKQRHGETNLFLESKLCHGQIFKILKISFRLGPIGIFLIS